MVSEIQPEQDFYFYLGFYVAFNNVQVISRWVVGRAEETSIYSLLGFCTVNCRPTASNYQLSHLRPCRESNPGLKRWEARAFYHSATVAPEQDFEINNNNNNKKKKHFEGRHYSKVQGQIKVIP